MTIYVAPVMGQGTAKLIYVQTSASPLCHYYIHQGSHRERKRGGKGMGCDKYVCSFVIFFPPLWVSILSTEKVFYYKKHYNEHFSWRSNRDGSACCWCRLRALGTGQHRAI